MTTLARSELPKEIKLVILHLNHHYDLGQALTKTRRGWAARTEVRKQRVTTSSSKYRGDVDDLSLCWSGQPKKLTKKRL
jgi:hypothetical protein